jgi:hypothetical protein
MYLDKDLQNFAVFEYLECYRERLSHLDISVNESLARVKSADTNEYTVDFQKNCQIALSEISKLLKHELTELQSVKYSTYDELTRVFTRQKNIDDLSEALRAIEKAISQRFSPDTEKGTFFPELSLASFNPRIGSAVDNLVRCINDKFFSNLDKTEEFDPNKILPIAIFGDGPRYKIDEFTIGQYHVYLVNIPRTDIYRFRFWTHLGHELAHLKISRSVQTNFSGQPMKGIKYPSEGQSLYNKLIDDISAGIGGAYLASKKFCQDYSNKKVFYGDYIHKQIEEIIADTAAIRIFGIAYLMSMMAWVGDPTQDIDKLAYHPQIIIRINNMIQQLERKPEAKQGKYSLTLTELVNDWKAIEQRIRNEGGYTECFEFVDLYQVALQKGLDNICDFVEKYLISDDKVFSPELWNTWSIEYEAGKTATPSACNKTPIEIIIRSWVKRWTNYLMLKTAGKNNFSDFANYHRTETKIMGQIINELNGV